MNKVEEILAGTARRMGLEVSRVSSRRNRVPVEATPLEVRTIGDLSPYTMTSSERLWSLLRAVTYLEAEQIPGDFVECGVWRGGSAMAMLEQLRHLGSSSRELWLYDTYSGMTPPSSFDVEHSTGRTAADLLTESPKTEGDSVWCIASLDDVRANISGIGYPMNRVHFVQGDVAETLKEQVPEQIALLRLDTDWYESTRASLEYLYPRLVAGGICILDDYGHWEGARKAVDDFFQSQGTRPLMHPIDYSGRIFHKPASHA